MSRGPLSRNWSWKTPAFVGLTLVVVVGIVVASIWADDRTDRRRPLYKSVVRMEQVQWDLLKAGQEPTPLTISHRDGARMIGTTKYRPEPGVTIEVAQRGDQTCVHGENTHDDRTGWICVDPTQARPKMGGLD